MPNPMPLPVEQILPDLHLALDHNRPVVLQAPPGSGKTVLVAPSLLHANWLKGRKILLLEPRRLAARMAANYMARQRGEPVGTTIGYQVRLENRTSPTTRIDVLTEGILTQRLLQDPELNGIGCIIFDEYHERSIHTDMGMALVDDVRKALREDLRLVIMSATLDPQAIRTYLGPQTKTLTCQARRFPVDTIYLSRPSTLPLWKSTAEAILRALEQEHGSILAFLPGEGEIHHCEDYLRERIQDENTIIAPLYARLDRPLQDQAVRPAPANCRKIVLATSIAESSVTIEGIRIVIDSGKVRVPRLSPTTGMPRLETIPISHDRAEQRKGRAGRLEPGVCWRLWDKSTDAQLQDSALPEITQADLSFLVLQAADWYSADLHALRWPTPPPVRNWQMARTLLEELGALTPEGRLTAHGKALVRYPLHPRLGNLILRAEAFGWGNAACHLAAEIAEEPGLATQLKRRLEGRKPQDHSVPPGLLLALGYPDRIAKRREGDCFLLSDGSVGTAESGRVPPGEWVVVRELQDMGQKGLRIRSAEAFDLAWIERYFPHLETIREVTRWDRRKDGVQAVRQKRLGAIVVTETPLSNAGNLLEAQLEGLRLKGISNLDWSKGAMALRARMAFLQRICGDDGWPDLSDEALLHDAAEWLPVVAPKALKWEQLHQIDLSQVLLSFYLKGRRAELDRLAPSDFLLPSGARCRIHYEAEIPFAELRIQEAFGLQGTPRIAGGKVAVLLHLLSPARRPVQVTSDLKSFWDNGYALVRKELRGRYPKHYWPEDPYQAEPLRGNRVRPPTRNR